MSIPEVMGKIKGRLGGGGFFSLSHDLFVILLIILTALASFGLGRLSVLEHRKTPIRIETAAQAGALGAVLPQGQEPIKGVAHSESLEAASLADLGISSEGGTKSFVAAKTGKKYYFPWCSGAARIAEANKIWFSSKEEAQAKGYTAAANCKGLQ